MNAPVAPKRKSVTLKPQALEVIYRARQEGTPERNALEDLVGKLPEKPSESAIIELLTNIGVQQVAQTSADIGYAQLALTISDAELATQKKLSQDRRAKRARRMRYIDEEK